MLTLHAGIHDGRTKAAAGLFWTEEQVYRRGIQLGAEAGLADTEVYTNHAVLLQGIRVAIKQGASPLNIRVVWREAGCAPYVVMLDSNARLIDAPDELFACGVKALQIIL